MPNSAGGAPSDAHEQRTYAGARDVQPLRGLPELSHEQLALLTSRQEVVVCTHCRVEGYTLAGREARRVWEVELPAPVTALADSQTGIVVAAGGALHRVGSGGAVPLVQIDGRVRNLQAVGVSVYAVVSREGQVEGKLVEVDPLRGAIVSERSLRSAATRLSADSAGRYLGLADGATFRTMATRRADPCAGRERPPESTPRPKSSSTPDPCCCRKSEPLPTESPVGSGETTSAPAPEPCDPGQSGVPTPGGGRVVGDGSGVTQYPPDGGTPRDPCRSHLFFESYQLYAAGPYFVAADSEAKNVAILDAADLSVVQRFQSRHGSVLLSHPAQPLMLRYQRGVKLWEAQRFDEIQRNALDLVPATLDSETGGVQVMTFTGSPMPGLKGERAKTTGTIKVLVIPMLDPGQAFTDADLPKLKKYLQRVAYNNVELFYRENSFGLLEYLVAAQRPDGGWSMASLTENPSDTERQSEEGRKARAQKEHGREFLVYVGREKVYKSSLASDGYATGFSLYVLRQAGLRADDPVTRRGVTWLKEHQRASGRWFTPSQGWHTQHYISNAGTAYVILALHACGEIPAPPKPGK